MPIDNGILSTAFIGSSHKGEVLKPMDRLWNRTIHPLLRAVNDAFNYHLPLTFSPDIIWQTILQGISQHINIYPEKYRKFLVSHENKKDLCIFRPDLSIDDLQQISQELPSITKQFVESIKNNVSFSHFNALQVEFSTTTEIVRVTSAISMMEAVSSYFSYTMITGCGFPEIKLKGRLDDWLKIRSRIDHIEELFYIDTDVNLTWWTEKLKKVLDHFIRAARGEPMIDWWKKMYKQLNEYLTTKFNGWIGWLFPYVRDRDISHEKKLCKNPMLENIEDKITLMKHSITDAFNGTKTVKYSSVPQKTEEFIFTDENQRTFDIDWMFQKYKGSCFLPIDVFPIGLSKVDLKIIDLLKGELDTVLFGGFLGVIQSKEDYGLKPLLGYALGRQA